MTKPIDPKLAKFLIGSKAKERLYHGTGNLESLTAFDPAMTGKGTDQLGSGFYLTNDPEEASGYAGKFNPSSGKENKSPGVIPAHVAIRKPIKIGPKGMSLNDARINLSHDQVKQIMGHAPNLHHPEESPLNNHVDTSRGVTPKMIHDIAKLYTGNNLHALENDIFPSDPTAYRTALNKVLGYDGVVKDFGNGRKHYVAWFPEQIKSAIGNRGTYDPTNPDITKAKGGEVSVTAVKKRKDDKIPELELAAKALLAGVISRAEYDKTVKKLKPVSQYQSIPRPATDEEALGALHENKRQHWRGASEFPKGHPVGLRLDIPAYSDHGVWVNSIHDESGAKTPVKYGPVSAVRNAEFDPGPSKAQRVATGETNKSPFAKIKGEWQPMTDEEAVTHMQQHLSHPDYVQVGYDPRRRDYFYHRGDTRKPITHAEHVVQIGPLVLAKNPVYGKRKDFGLKDGGVAHMAAGGEPDLSGNVDLSTLLDEPSMWDKFKSGAKDFVQDTAAPALQSGLNAVFPARKVGNIMIDQSIVNPIKKMVGNPYGYMDVSSENAADVDRARRHQENYIRDALGMNQMPSPELDLLRGAELTPYPQNRKYPKRGQPKANGGRVTHAHHLDIEERPL